MASELRFFNFPPNARRISRMKANKGLTKCPGTCNKNGQSKDEEEGPKTFSEALIRGKHHLAIWSLHTKQSGYAVRMRFCQCVQMNHANPPTSATNITASNLCRYFPSDRQLSPSFIPNQASAKHHGHDPRNV